MHPAITQLALDTQLPVDHCENLRWWESDSLCVVLGHGCNAEADVDMEACGRDGVPVLRRESGGGTVLVGPGCVNFSLALQLAKRPELENIAASYAILLPQVAAALGVRGLSVASSDLLLDGRKISGSAQRRTGGWLLHHATVLYAMDLDLIGKYLRQPLRSPSHRGGRTHRNFLANLPLGVQQIQTKLKDLAKRLGIPCRTAD